MACAEFIGSQIGKGWRLVDAQAIKTLTALSPSYLLINKEITHRTARAALSPSYLLIIGKPTLTDSISHRTIYLIAT